MKKILFLLILISQLVVSLAIQADSVDISVRHNDAIGEYIQLMSESNGSLTLDDAIAAYQQDRFSYSSSQFISLGIGVKPVWLRFSVNNPDTATLFRRLSVKTSWLDHIQVYFVRDEKQVKHDVAGDKYIHPQRPGNGRFFDFDYEYPPGETTVYMRVASDDPMVLPVYLSDTIAAEQDEIFDSYSYGILYGMLGALLIYNLLVFIALKSKRYLYYSVYVASFILMNMSYTGHGFRWFWSESIQWQQWGNPILMVVYALAGLLFATSFLQTRFNTPKTYENIIFFCIFIANLELLLIIFNNQVAALLVAFSFAFIFTFTMLYLGIVSFKRGVRSARYFLLASVTHVSLSSLTALTVWGIIPYTTFGYRALEFGMVFDAIILSIALVDQFRIISEEKTYAEQLAMTDHLTGVKNRRAFYDLVRPIWSSCLRKKREMCVIMIDIDNFKQINDCYGHKLGDEILKTLSHVLLDNVRDGDIFARWGGEEFIVFLPETVLLEAIDIAERFRTLTLSVEFPVPDKTISITISVGVAQNIGLDTEIDELIMEADKALYVAKEQGRNRVSVQMSGQTGI